MSITLRCHANCDDVFLTWHADTEPGGVVDGCLGYAVEVRDEAGKVEALSNLKGFEQDHPQAGQTRPSTEWPLQTFSWTDHSALFGRRLQFRVTAMIGRPGALQRGAASDWSDWVELSPNAGADASAFFNRGIVLSQFVARYAKDNQLTSAKALKDNLRTHVTSPLMQFLTGELGRAIRGIVQQAQQDTSLELYACLFELDLEDLVDGLAALGPRVHLVLANGSVKDAGDDENKGAAARLDGRIDLHRRFSAPKGLAHNKFLVVCRNGKPEGVWTGSTNWTLTGLHTQINNGLAIASAALAQTYLDQWRRIVAAGDAFTPDLVHGNAKARGPIPLAGGATAHVWFTPVPQSQGALGADIADLVARIEAAEQGILFVMFMPGQEPLDSIIRRQQQGLYVRGVASTLPMGSKEKPSPTYQLLNSSVSKPYALDIVQPEGVDAVGDFLATFTRQQFLQGMGFAITHSKVIVIDPFGAKPVLVTGSHNLSASASGKNDENLLIIEGQPALARAYAVNCMSVYAHYRWPAHRHDVKTGAAAGSSYLATGADWQAKRLDADTRADLNFWAA